MDQPFIRSSRVNLCGRGACKEPRDWCGNDGSCSMPRYFFHTSAHDHLIQDATGLELPDLARSEDAELTLALWFEILDSHLRTNRALVITDAVGKVLFVTAR